MQIGLELEEIQVAPGSLDSIMNRATRLAAYRTWEPAAALKIDVEI